MRCIVISFCFKRTDRSSIDKNTQFKILGENNFILHEERITPEKSEDIDVVIIKIRCEMFDKTLGLFCIYNYNKILSKIFPAMIVLLIEWFLYFFFLLLEKKIKGNLFTFNLFFLKNVKELEKFINNTAMNALCSK